MPPSPDASNSWLFISRMAVHQDYAWFAALLFWSLALVVWRWHPQRRDAWAWLPLPAFAGVLSAVVQFGIYSPPFDFFLAAGRRLPGRLAPRPFLSHPPDVLPS